MTMNLVTMLFVYKNLLGEYLGGKKQMQLTSYNEPFYTNLWKMKLLNQQPTNTSLIQTNLYILLELKIITVTWVFQVN